MEPQDIDRICVELMEEHGCHTAIVYGSWARGDATADSDVDILFVGRNRPAVRDARVRDGVYIDAFVYPESSLAEPDAPLLRVLGGRVVREQDGFGTAFLEKLRELYDRGPKPMPEDERRAVLAWSRKMLERIVDKGGLEVDYRRMQLVMQSLEDYFGFRNAWFKGSKASFAWLLEHDEPTYRRFESAFRQSASDSALAELVDAVYGPFEREARIDPQPLRVRQ